ncbi:MAG: choice-of-anchor D domain-containing protein [Candidatus Binatales bacterium]
MSSEAASFRRRSRLGALAAGCASVALITMLAIAGTPGSVGDTTADVVLGQVDFGHNMLNLGGLGALQNPQAVAIDSQGHLYIADTANNRVLGWKSVAGLANGASGNIVIGQPDNFSNSCSGLCAPDSVAVDSAGNLYVATGVQVFEYNSPFNSGSTAGQQANVTFGQPSPPFLNIAALTVDQSGNLYVADSGNNRVLEYNTPLSKTAVAGSGDTIPDLVFGQDGSFSSTGCNDGTNLGDANGVGADSLCAPTGIAVDSAGNVYIADTGNNRVLEYDTPLATTATSGSGDTNADAVFGQAGAFATGCGATNAGLCGPQGLVLDSGNNLYVADTGNNRVLEYNTPLTNNIVPGSGDSIADNVFGQKGSFSATACSDGVGGNPAPSSTGLCGPLNVATDPAGDLFVADAPNNRVVEFNTPLISTGVPGSGDTTADFALGQVDLAHNIVNFGGSQAMALTTAYGTLFAGAAVDASGHLYLADVLNNRILGWKNVAAVTNTVAADLVIGQPDAFTSNCAATQTGLCFCSAGLNGLCSGTGKSSQDVGGGVAVDSAGNLYVADTGNNRVLEFNAPFSSGTLAGQAANLVFGQGSSFTASACTSSAVAKAPKTSVNGLCAPTGVALDPIGNLYVADSINNRVLEYNTPLTKTSVSGSGDVKPDVVFGQHGSFSLDSCNDGVAAGDSHGLGPDSLCGPQGLAADSAGNLYVADDTNNRVLEYTTPLLNPASPNTTADIAFGQGGSLDGDTCSISAAGLCKPEGVVLDSAGNLYIADTGNNRVLEYNTPLAKTMVAGSGDATADGVFGQAGSFTTKGCSDGVGGDPAPSADGLCDPTGVAADSAGDLLVADLPNNRLLKFNQPLAVPTASPTPSPTPTPGPSSTATPTPTPSATPAPTAAPSGRLSLSTRVLNFGAIGTDTNKTLAFKVANVGKGTLSGSIDASSLPLAFSVTGGGSFSLPTNHGQRVEVKLAPTAPGSFATEIKVTSSDPKNTLVDVLIEGTANPGRIKAPQILAFGQVKIGATSTKTFKVTNLGPGMLHGQAGTLAAPFQVTAGGSSFTLPGGHAASISVEFAPMSTALENATLTITSDDPVHPSIGILMNGSGK